MKTVLPEFIESLKGDSPRYVAIYSYVFSGFNIDAMYNWLTTFKKISGEDGAVYGHDYTHLYLLRKVHQLKLVTDHRNHILDGYIEHNVLLFNGHLGIKRLVEYRLVDEPIQTPAERYSTLWIV